MNIIHYPYAWCLETQVQKNQRTCRCDTRAATDVLNPRESGSVEQARISMRDALVRGVEAASFLTNLVYEFTMPIS